MSDKRTGKKVKKVAAAQPRPDGAPAVVVSDLTRRPAMKKQSPR